MQGGGARADRDGGGVRARHAAGGVAVHAAHGQGQHAQARVRQQGAAVLQLQADLRVSHHVRISFPPAYQPRCLSALAISVP